MRNSMIKAVVKGRMNAHDEYERYKPKRDIGMEVVRKLRKGISSADVLHQGS